MDWLTWFNSLAQPIQDVLTGATGDLAGGLVGQAVTALLGEATGRVRRRFEPTPQSEALHRAMARALVETLAAVDAEPDVQAELLGHFTRWLERPDVAGELTQVIAPDPKAVELKLELLEAEFEAAGFAPELLGHARDREAIDFAELVARFVHSFYNAACLEPELSPAIELQLLRGMAERLETLVKNAKTQTRVLEDIHRLLRSFEPLDLEPLERSYLEGLYWECNDLRLIKDPRSQPGPAAGPRLQRVYVEVRTTEPPTDDLVLKRLDVPAGQRPQTLQSLKRALAQKDAGASGVDPIRGGRNPRGEIAERLGSLDDKQMEAVARSLGAAPQAVRAALKTMTPLDALRQEKQIVVVGDPGSGKSMLTQRLAALLAAAGSEDRAQLNDLSDQERSDMQDLLTQAGSRLLPVRILLSRWERHASRPACADDLIDECVRTFGETVDVTHSGFKWSFVRNRLSGDAPTALILLDGLDEVTDEARRAWQLAAVEDFHRHFRRVPLLVTCRVRPYEAWEKEGKVLSLPAFKLAGLSDAAVTQFAERWYGELLAAGIYEEPEQARQARLRLHDAIFNTARPNHKELRAMAATPLLLTMMAHVNYRKALPDSRAALYAQFADQLLYKWEEYRLAPGQEARLTQMLDQVKSDMEQFKLALAGLAFQAYSKAASRDLVDIPSHEFEHALRRLPRSEMNAGDRAKWATDVLELIAARSGLIVALDEHTYRFSHLSLQEYMTATHLVVGSSDDKLRNFTPVIDKPLWREVVQLGLGILTKVLSPPQIGDALHIVGGLLPAAVTTTTDAQRLLLLGETYLHVLAVDSLAAPNKRQAHDVLRELVARLTDLMTAEPADPHQRLAAGLLLADLDDALARVDASQRPPGLSLAPPGLDDFIPIPGLPGVRIGKYPVTNRQFLRFMEAGGYDRTQPWWTPQAIREIESWEKNWPSAPRLWDEERFNHSTQPVVGVSWYEAQAYCAWLTGMLRARPADAGGIRADERVALPSEEEWLLAARGGRPAPADEAQDYPWRGPFATWRANTGEHKETDLRQTSPVHMYPGGATAEGVFDLAGNVWEWTRNVDKDGWPWLKGGSWWDNPSGVTPAARYGDFPRFRNGYWGLRVVVVPVSRISPGF